MHEFARKFTLKTGYPKITDCELLLLLALFDNDLNMLTWIVKKKSCHLEKKSSNILHIKQTRH